MVMMLTRLILVIILQYIQLYTWNLMLYINYTPIKINIVKF